jgi:hypothetical protein
MKMDKVAGSGNDEFYTPRYAVEPILKYIPVGAVIYCPFDTIQSHFVKMLKERGNKVYCSHISEGQDFFDRGVPSGIDYIISNPPYSLKTEVFQKLFEWKKNHSINFAMLVGVVGLFESQKRFEMFRDNKFEIMYLNRRVSYLKDYNDPKPALNPPFSSVYVCSGVLPRDIVFEEIKKQ